MNPLLLTDFYKVGHILQYPKGTTLVYSNFTPRKSRIEGINEVVFFGLQYFIKKYLIEEYNTNFFNKPLSEVIDSYKRILDNSLDGYVSMDHVIALHKLGYLPIEIKALPEGSLVPMRVPMFTIRNTLPEFYWITNFLETILSTTIWGACTSATISLEYKKILNKYADETSGHRCLVPYQAHDFSFRGMFGLEAALISGAGHLLNFIGTDTIPVISFLEKYYNANSSKELTASSVPATEHSVMCMGGEETETETYKRLLTEVYPDGIVSIVSDTWNLWDVLTKTLVELKDIVLQRKGKLVIRPDCYDTKTEILTNVGWKFFKDLNKETDLVAQFDNGDIVFIKPLEYIEEEYTGEMINFTSAKNKIDILVTPNHRMLQYNKKLKTYQIKEASKIKYSYNKDLPVSGLKQGKIDSLTAYEKLLIAFQADGRCRVEENRNFGVLGGKYIVDFQFAKQRKIIKLKNICEEGNFKYKITEPKSREFSKHNGKWNDQVSFYVYLNNRPIKEFKNWVDFTDKSYLWCREFINEVSNWDATIRSDNRIKFDNTNKNNAEIVQIATILSGYRSTFTISEDKRSTKYNDINTVYIVKNKTYVDGQVIKKQVVNYSGKVYCVKVPSGMLVIRRNNQVVISGNSGNPVEIICGKADSYNNNVKKGVIEVLWDIFGGSINEKGYKVLDSHIGCIYGDSITLERCKEICERLKQKGFASSNIIFGVGSYTFQYTTRDTFGFAVKSTYGEINNEPREIFKDPITDNVGKKSAKGLLKVVIENGKYKLIDQVSKEEETQGELRTVFKNGNLIKNWTLSEIRARCEINSY